MCRQKVQKLLKKQLLETLEKKNYKICDYNLIKDGIDHFDHTISYYSQSRKSMKWHRRILFEAIEIVVVK